MVINVAGRQAYQQAAAVVGVGYFDGVRQVRGQRGEVEFCGEVVNCQGIPLPSAATIQMAEFRRF